MIAVSDLMTRNVFVASEQDKILHIRKLMIERKISRVVIIDERNKPIGIITDKDVLRYIVDDTSGMDLDNLPASKLMSHPVITVQDSLSVQAAAKKMYDARISSLVVVNTNDNLVGIITKTDLCAFFALSMKGKFRVEGNADLADAAKLMLMHKISGLPVIDNKRKVLGIITKTDILNALAESK